MEFTAAQVIMTREEFDKLIGKVEAYESLLRKVEKLEKRMIKISLRIGLAKT